MLAGQAIRAKVWRATDFSKVLPKKLKKMVREGVASDMRRELWLDLSSGTALRQKFAEDYFAKLALK